MYNLYDKFNMNHIEYIEKLVQIFMGKNSVDFSQVLTVVLVAAATTAPEGNSGFQTNSLPSD